jgi:release factor glutamine methyltransferase
VQNWTIRDLLTWTTGFFRDKGIREPRLEAEILLAHVLGQNRVYLYTNYDAPVNQNERDKFREFIKRRSQHEPSAYITGTKEFMSLEFIVNPAVLIPRPESELLVERAVKLFQDQPCVICDVGTGSGAIAVSLALYLPQAKVYATDISPAALATAQANAARLEAEVEFREGDLLSPFLDRNNYFDLIVANLPYITADEYQDLEPGVKDYEPVTALLAPGDGLDIYRRLLPQALSVMKPGAYIMMEIGYEQGEQAVTMLEDMEEVQLIPDLAGRDRIIQARKGG